MTGPAKTRHICPNYTCLENGTTFLGHCATLSDFLMINQYSTKISATYFEYFKSYGKLKFKKYAKIFVQMYPIFAGLVTNFNILYFRSIRNVLTSEGALSHSCVSYSLIDASEILHQLIIFEDINFMNDKLTTKA